MKLFSIIYKFIFITIGIISVVLSFFPILIYYLIPLNLIIIFLELYRLKKIHQFLFWIFKKEKKEWDVRNSIILSLSFYSIIICIFLYISLWVIMELFYIYPVKQELTKQINLK